MSQDRQEHDNINYIQIGERELFFLQNNQINIGRLLFRGQPFGDCRPFERTHTDLPILRLNQQRDQFGFDLHISEIIVKRQVSFQRRKFFHLTRIPDFKTTD